MNAITPCRALVSDRFPVASFVVRVPESRCFEVACATDPRLFLPAWRGHRTGENFYSTRAEGLLSAPHGETTVLLPPEQLHRFRGNERVYFALGTYGGREGQDPQFTLNPSSLDTTPYVQLSADFSGRGLRSRSLLLQRSYGGREDSLSWGPDLVGFDAPQKPKAPDAQGYGGRAYGYVVDPRAAYEPASASPPRAQAMGAPHPDDYGATAQRPAVAIDALNAWGATETLGLNAMAQEPEGLAEPPSWDGAESSYGRPVDEPLGIEEPPGLEEPPAQTSAAGYGGRHGPAAEPEGYEDPSAWLAAQPQASTYGTRSEPARPQSPPRALKDAIGHVLGPVIRARGLDDYGLTDIGPRGGLRWGFIGHCQHSGALCDVLKLADARDRAWAGRGTPLFDQVFGARRAAALRAWLEHPSQELVDGEALSSPRWLQDMTRAGQLHRPPPAGMGLPSNEDPFKAAQNEIMVRDLLLPHLDIARELNLRTAQGLAVLFETLLEHGPKDAATWLQASLGPQGGTPERLRALPTAATQAGHYNAHRLNQILKDSDANRDLHISLDD